MFVESVAVAIENAFVIYIVCAEFVPAYGSVSGFGGFGRCRRARPSNSDNQQQKQLLAQHSHGARARCALALSPEA